MHNNLFCHIFDKLMNNKQSIEMNNKLSDRKWCASQNIRNCHSFSRFIFQNSLSFNCQTNEKGISSNIMYVTIHIFHFCPPECKNPTKDHHARHSTPVPYTPSLALMILFHCHQLLHKPKLVKMRDMLSLIFSMILFRSFILVSVSHNKDGSS